MATSSLYQSNVLRSRQVVLLLILIPTITILAIIIYSVLSRTVYNPDPFIYTQAIKQLFSGEALYAGAWQDRPPLGLLFYALPQSIAPGSYQGMEEFLALWLFIQGLLFAWVTREKPWVALGVFSFVILFPITNWDFFWPSTEHAANMFVAVLLLSAYVILRNKQADWKVAVLVGTATTFAFHIRQSTLLFCFVPLVSFLSLSATWRTRLYNIIIVICAGLMSWGLLLACLFPFTDMSGYWHTTFHYPFLFARQDLGETRWQLISLLRFTPLLPYTLFFLVLSVYGRYRLLAILAVTAGLAASVASPRAHMHYWVQMHPVVALLILLAFDGGFEPSNGNKYKHVKIKIALMLLIILGVSFIFNSLYLAHKRQNGVVMHKVADAINSLALPHDSVFVSAPMPADYIQFALNIPPAHRYYCCWQLRLPRADLLPEPLVRIFNEYIQHPPSLLVVHREYLEAIYTSPDQLSEDIQLVKKLMAYYKYTVIANIEGYVVLRRSGADK